MDVLPAEVDGYTILIEVREPNAKAPLTDESKPPVARGDALDRTVDRLDQLGGTVAGVTKKLYGKIIGSGDLIPDEMTLEFGVSLSGELGIPLVSKASGEGTLTVTATWRKNDNAVAAPAAAAAAPPPRGR